MIVFWKLFSHRCNLLTRRFYVVVVVFVVVTDALRQWQLAALANANGVVCFAIQSVSPILQPSRLAPCQVVAVAHAAVVHVRPSPAPPYSFVVGGGSRWKVVFATHDGGSLLKQFIPVLIWALHIHFVFSKKRLS